MAYGMSVFLHHFYVDGNLFGKELAILLSMCAVFLGCIVLFLCIWVMISNKLVKINQAPAEYFQGHSIERTTHSDYFALYLL